ncbi:MAG: carbamoyl-phosphate synthase, partial [Cyanobacteria bacterium]|nr:carbamoyl-phosphate synthase [Cyanobacteriota bacterium]
MHKIKRILPALAAGLSLGLTSLPASRADQPTPAQLKLLQLDLWDAVKPTWGFQGQQQGAGTPNSIGIGAFLPLA